MMSTYNFFTNPEDQELRRYFDSLPVYIQESIKQSGIQVLSREHLQKLAKNIMETL